MNDSKTSAAASSNNDPNRTTRLIDRGTLIVLVAIALVAGTLSARGAEAMFQSGWIQAIAFGATVQCVVTACLWLLPHTRRLIRLFMVLAWIIGVTFSIGSAYFATYASNSTEVAEELKDDVSRAFAESKKNIQKVKTAAATAEMRTHEEVKHGTYSLSLPGVGPQARKLRAEALDAKSHAEEAVETEKVVDAALEKLQQPGMSTEAIRGLYNDTMARIGAYSEGITAPDFQVDRRSYTTVVFSAYAVALGRDSGASKNERTRVVGSLITASVMEILGLLCALVRMGVHAETNRSTPRDDPAGGLIWALLAVVRVGDRLKDAIALSKEEAKRSSAILAARLRQATSSLYAAKQEQPPVNVWSNAIVAYTGLFGPARFRAAIESLLPDYPSARRRNDQADDGLLSLFDDRVFEGKPSIVQAAITTKVVNRVNGRLVPGPMWDAWIQFLLELLASPPPRRPGRTATGRPNLKVVGAR